MELKVGRNNVEPALAILATACMGYYLGAAIYANLLLRSPFVGPSGSVGDWEGIFLILSLLGGLVVASFAILTAAGFAGIMASLTAAARLSVVMAWLPVKNRAGRTAVAAMVGTLLGSLAFGLVAIWTVEGALGKAAALSILGVLPGLAAGLVMAAMTQPKRG